MCEKCEEREHNEKIVESQKKCENGHHCPVDPKIVNVNREVEDPIAESKKIDEVREQRHFELINGYDKQLGDCLTDIAKFSTKMLIMFEDYKKKGNTDSMVKLLQSIYNYALVTRTTTSVVIQSAEMLVGKVSNHG